MGIPTLGLCLLIAACVPADGGEDAAPPAPPAPEKGHVDIDGVTLEYRDYGGTGDLLLFVPSLFMTADVYDRVAPHFTDRYRVLAVTHRWHGTSEQTGLDFTLDTTRARPGRVHRALHRRPVDRFRLVAGRNASCPDSPACGRPMSGRSSSPTRSGSRWRFHRVSRCPARSRRTRCIPVWRLRPTISSPCSPWTGPKP